MKVLQVNKKENKITVSISARSYALVKTVIMNILIMKKEKGIAVEPMLLNIMDTQLSEDTTIVVGYKEYALLCSILNELPEFKLISATFKVSFIYIMGMDDESVSKAAKYLHDHKDTIVGSDIGTYTNTITFYSYPDDIL